MRMLKIANDVYDENVTTVLKCMIPDNNQIAILNGIKVFAKMSGSQRQWQGGSKACDEVDTSTSPLPLMKSK